MQLHQLPGVVLVDVPRGVLVVIEIVHHRRMLEGRQHQILEMPERVRADRPIGVVGDQPAQIRFALMHAEMVEPEPHHFLLELIGRVGRPQQLAAHRLVGELVAALVERFAGRLSVGPIGHCLVRLALGVDLGDGAHRIQMSDLERRELGGHGRRQALVALQLTVQVTGPTEPVKLLDARAIDAETHPLQPEHVLPRKRLHRGSFCRCRVVVHRVRAAGKQSRAHGEHGRRHGKQRRRRLEQSGRHGQERRAQQGSQRSTLVPLRAHMPPKSRFDT